MRTISKEELRKLYYKDFLQWLMDNIELIKKRDYSLVDWENLLEELEDMGRSIMQEGIRRMARIIEHMYKWDNFRGLTKAGAEKGGISWVWSIENQRYELSLLMKRNPSLKKLLPERVQEAWEESIALLRNWLANIGKDPAEYEFPTECPYTYEDLLYGDLRKEIPK